MRQRISQVGRSFGLHVRRQAVGYAALVVALGGSAYAGTKGNSSKIGGKDLRPFVERLGTQATIQGGDSGQSTAECKRGERALAPLGAGSAQNGNGAVVNSFAALGLPKRQGFVLTVLNPTTQPQAYQARVLCLRR
jgi:hypothetical protein